MAGGNLGAGLYGLAVEVAAAGVAALEAWIRLRAGQFTVLRESREETKRTVITMDGSSTHSVQSAHLPKRLSARDTSDRPVRFKSGRRGGNGGRA
ncbi:hypothetical protein [Streptomyces sp. NPDC054863]